MKKVNRLTICKEDYKNQEDFKNAIKDAIMVLLNNYYIMTVRYDDSKEMGIVVIDYEHDNLEYGCRYPYWLFPEGEETVVYQED